MNRLRQRNRLPLSQFVRWLARGRPAGSPGRLSTLRAVWSSYIIVL